MRQQGWSEDNIILIDDDAGVSAWRSLDSTKSTIDSRQGMSRLVDLISDAKIGAIAVTQEDRLFRDETNLDAGPFAYLCRRNHVLLLTPHTVYDFAHPAIGEMHIKTFLQKVEFGAEYIKSYISGHLRRSRRKVCMSGCFAGGPVSVGFMVDVRAEVGGTPNPNYRKYTPFQPYAEVVLEYFRLLVEEFAGNKTACARHISLYGPYYPSLTHVPDGFKVGKRYPCSKSYPTLPGLEKMWTNAVYIGHWAVEGCIIKRNNHPAIVPEDLFMAAFNYLSPIGLDGTPNPNYRPVREHARPMLEEHRKAERPLYAGLVYIRLSR